MKIYRLHGVLKKSCEFTAQTDIERRRERETDRQREGGRETETERGADRQSDRVRETEITEQQVLHLPSSSFSPESISQED